MSTILEELRNYRTILEASGRVYFEGVLCTLDQPSDKPLSGSKKHRVLLPTYVAEKAIQSLVGAPLNATPYWDGHAEGWKTQTAITIGLITKGFIEENQIKVRGYLSTAESHTIVDRIKEIENSNPLGMSFEMLGARVENINSNIWTLNRAKFSGVSILRRDKAAYTTSSFQLLDKTSQNNNYR